MIKQYRYPGAKPFHTDEQHIFFGRAADTEELYQQISLESLVILHAKSGLGKSSLINAGLLPKIAAIQDFKPLPIRLYAHTEDEKFSPLDRSRTILAQESDLLNKIRPDGDNSLWYHLKSRQLTMPRHQKTLLVFDQFEELFTYSEEAIADFGRQLSEAIYTTLPQRFRDQRRAGFEQNPNFLSPEELELLDQPLELRVLIAIRSDRLSLLKKLKAWLPTILLVDFELKALSREQAEDAILTPAYQREGFCTPVFDYEEAAIEYLLNFLSEDGTEAIESFQLQILCEYVERIVVEQQGKTLIEKSDLHNPDEILENYYLDKIKAITDPTERLAARRLIEEGLIFEEEERRLSVYEGQVRRTYGISDNLLRQLLDTHLIRSEPSLRGGYTYELSHDTLVVPVLKAKAKRITEEKIAQAAAEQQRRAQEVAALKAQAEKERQLREQAEQHAHKAERQQRLAIAFLLVATIAAIFAFFQQRAAVKEGEKAIQEQKKAEAALKNFQKSEQDRLQVEIHQLLNAAQTLRASEDDVLAQEKLDSAQVRWKQAMGLDSSRVEILELKQLLEGAKSLDLEE